MDNGFLKTASKEKQYSEKDIARFDYYEEKPFSFNGNDYVWDAVELTDIRDIEKVNRNGQEYISHFGRLTFYDDDNEVKLSFPFNLWENNYTEEGNVVFKSNNPVTNLIKSLLDDDENNVFTVDYSMLQDAISEIYGIVIEPKIISEKNGFTVYGFSVVSIDF